MPSDHVCRAKEGPEVVAKSVSGKTLRTVKTFKCVVCDMAVDLKSSPPRLHYDGKVYYFCCPDCRQTFEVSPQKYVSARIEPTAAQPVEP